tara:strand:- start:199 stop:417 length:219 start_codon:yes stop_codon:yes gene_type:complete
MWIGNMKTLYTDFFLTINNAIQSTADEKRQQKEKLKKIVKAETKKTANLIKAWLTKQKNQPSKNFGTRGKVT